MPGRRRRSRRAPAGPLVLAALVASSCAFGFAAPAAAAEDKTAARDHWERGTKFYDLGKYDDAIREFEAAYEAKGDPAFLYNLAQSHRLAGHPAESLRFYRTYLRYVPKAPNRPDIEDRIKELEKTIADHPGGEAATSTSPPPNPSGGSAGASAPPGAGASPPSSAPAATPGPGATGTPLPQAGASGAAGSTGAGATAAPPPFSVGQQGATVPPYASTSANETPPPARKSVRKVAGIAIAAGGGALIVVGGVFGLVARSQSKKVETAAANAERFDPSVQSLGKTAQTLQWIGYGVGVAAVVTGLVLYVTAPSQVEAPPPPRVAVAPLVVPGSGGAFSLRVTF